MFFVFGVLLGVLIERIAWLLGGSGAAGPLRAGGDGRRATLRRLAWASGGLSFNRLRAAYAFLASGILQEPATMPWGERQAYLADPEGNPVALATPV